MPAPRIAASAPWVLIRLDSVSPPQSPAVHELAGTGRAGVGTGGGGGRARADGHERVHAQRAPAHTTDRSERTAAIWSGSGRERHHSANEAISSSIDTR